MDSFTEFHPIVNLLYFVSVIGFTIFHMQPVCLVIAVIAATVYAVYLNGRKKVRFSVRFLLPVCLFAVFVNIAFNHAGMTILTYGPAGNPITLESIRYGIFAACLLAAAVQWFACWNSIMTSDKIVYLFGRILPRASLLITLALGFVPRLKTQTQSVRDAKKTMHDAEENSAITNAADTISRVLSRALDDAVCLSESMKSRGYGIGRRTCFHTYRWKRRDTAALLVIAALAAVMLATLAAGALYWQFFPYLDGDAVTPGAVTAYAAFAFLCNIPMAINVIYSKKTGTAGRNTKDYNRTDV